VEKQKGKTPYSNTGQNTKNHKTLNIHQPKSQKKNQTSANYKEPQQTPPKPPRHKKTAKLKNPQTEEAESQNPNLYAKQKRKHYGPILAKRKTKRKRTQETSTKTTK